MNNKIFSVLIYLGLVSLLPSCIDSDNESAEEESKPLWIYTTKVIQDITNVKTTISYTQKDVYNDDGQIIDSIFTNIDTGRAYIYNSDGLLSEKNYAFPSGQTRQNIYTYNMAQQLTLLTVVRDATADTYTEYTYDSNDRLSSMALSSGSSFTFNYDESGSSIKVNDQTGNFTSFKVNAFDNYTFINSYLAGQTEDVDTPTSSLSYTYNEQGLLLSAHEVFAGINNTTSYIYNYEGEHPLGLNLEHWTWATAQ